MKKQFPRPMLNSPVREGTPDAELLVKRVIARLDGSHEANYMLEQLMKLDRDFWLREQNQTELRKDGPQLSATCASWS